MLYERRWRTCRGYDPLNMMGSIPCTLYKRLRWQDPFWTFHTYTLFYESMQRELCTLFIIPIFCTGSQKNENEKCSVSRFREARCGIIKVDFLKIALRAFISRSKR